MILLYALGALVGGYVAYGVYLFIKGYMETIFTGMITKETLWQQWKRIKRATWTVFRGES